MRLLSTTYYELGKTSITLLEVSHDRIINGIPKCQRLPYFPLSPLCLPRHDSFQKLTPFRQPSFSRHRDSLPLQVMYLPVFRPSVINAPQPACTCKRLSAPLFNKRGPPPRLPSSPSILAPNPPVPQQQGRCRGPARRSGASERKVPLIKALVRQDDIPQSESPF